MARAVCHASKQMRGARWWIALTVVVATGVGAGCGAAQSRPKGSVPAISLTQIPGNALIPVHYRLLVSNTTIIRQRSGRAGGWRTISRWPVDAALRARLIADAHAIHPGSMHSGVAVCHGAPVGDVGGWQLRVGTLTSNCPPSSAGPLMRLLEPYLHPSTARG